MEKNSNSQQKRQDNKNNVNDEKCMIKIEDYLKGKPFPTIQEPEAKKESFRKYFLEKGG